MLFYFSFKEIYLFYLPDIFWETIPEPRSLIQNLALTTDIAGLHIRNQMSNLDACMYILLATILFKECVLYAYKLFASITVKEVFGKF